MTEARAGTGALLVNLGTPDSPSPGDVRRYLAEFLSDPRVISLPGPLRWLLLHGVILRTRPRRSAHAYAQIWRPDGSPLLIHGRELREAVADRLAPRIPVELAMRYGRPDVDGALDALARAGAHRVVVLPLFPQYSDAATESALAHVRARVTGHETPFELIEIESFHDHTGFLDTTAGLTRAVIDEIGAEHLLLSFHGLPEAQVRRVPGCLATPGCCEARGPTFARCYRAQCLATSEALRARLDLAPDACTTAFQSRVGPTRWIGPYTDVVIESLRARGVTRLAVVCPAFVADCLETLEEIGLRLRDRWLELGGRAFGLVPCVNAEPGFVTAVADLIRRADADATIGSSPPG